MRQFMLLHVVSLCAFLSDLLSVKAHESLGAYPSALHAGGGDHVPRDPKHARRHRAYKERVEEEARKRLALAHHVEVNAAGEIMQQNAKADSDSVLEGNTRSAANIGHEKAHVNKTEEGSSGELMRSARALLSERGGHQVTDKEVHQLEDSILGKINLKLNEVRFNQLNIPQGNIGSVKAAGLEMNRLAAGHVKVTDADMGKIEFKGLSSPRVNFGKIDITPFNIHGMNLNNVRARYADARGINVRNMHAENAKLNGAQLDNVKADNMRLHGLSMSGKLDLESAKLHNMDASGKIALHSVAMNDVDLNGKANLNSVVLHNMDVQGDIGLDTVRLSKMQLGSFALDFDHIAQLMTMAALAICLGLLCFCAMLVDMWFFVRMQERQNPKSKRLDDDDDDQNGNTQFQYQDYQYQAEDHAADAVCHVTSEHVEEEAWRQMPASPSSGSRRASKLSDGSRNVPDPFGMTRTASNKSKH